MNSNSNSNPDSRRREVDASLLSSLSRLSSRGHTVLASALGVLAGAASHSESALTSYAIPSWLTAFPDAPSSPNGRSSSGVAAAKRLARKQRNQRRARLARHA